MFKRAANHALFFVGNSEGQDCSFQARLNFFNLWALKVFKFRRFFSGIILEDFRHFFGRRIRGSEKLGFAPKLLCKRFRRALLQNPKGPPEFRVGRGVPGPVFGGLAFFPQMLSTQSKRMKSGVNIRDGKSSRQMKYH